MTDWQDANHNIDWGTIYTPNRGPENGHYDYVWRAEWEPKDNTYTWNYFLKYDNDGIVGFIQDDPFRGNIGTKSTDDTRYYVTNGWPSNIPFSGLSKPLPEMGTVLTHDNVTGGKHDDWLFLGPGNDRLSASGGNDYLYGGSHDDLVYGGAGTDRLFGDSNNAPVVAHQNFENQVFKWSIPSAADPAVVDGNDILHGGDHSDTLQGGGGNDQLDGGDRGQGWTDVLTGGAGADAFFLSYNSSANEAGSEEEGFWSAVIEDWVLDDAQQTTKQIVEKLAETAAEDFFKTLTGGLLLSGFSTGVESLAVNGLKSLLFKTPPAPPPPTSEDVMVVTDFDPREDTLILPVESGKTLTATPTFYASSAGEITDRWGIAFQHVDEKTNAVTNFAEVFLSDTFMQDAFQNEEGTTTNTPDVTDPNDADVPALLRQIVSQSLRVDSNGIQNPQHSYPFPTDPDAYTDGEVPEEVTDQLTLEAPEGGVVQIFGAFAPLSIVKPAIGSTFPTVVGSYMGDILNVNGVFFAPSDAPISQLASTGVTVKAFDGDDIVFAGNGQDFVYGGDGNDTIYGIGQSSVETREIFRGGNGDDTIFLGWTSTWAVADGGADTDTVDFTYLDPANFTGLTIDLEAGSGSATDLHDGFVSRYDVENIEHVMGSPGADTVAGGSGGEQLAGGEGEDAISGRGGYDTLIGGSGADMLQGDDEPDQYLGPQSDWVGDSLRIDSLDMLQIEGRTTYVTALGTADGWTEVDLGDGTSFRMQPADGTTTFDTLTQVISDGDLLLLGPDSTYDPDVLSGQLKDLAPPAGPGPHDGLVVGTLEDDELQGGDGDDLLHGFEGSDQLSGGPGNDIDVGGSGAFETLLGGPGADIFAFRHELENGAPEVDIIMDFESWPDAINLGGYRITEYREMSDAVLLSVGPDEDLILINGVSDLDRIVFVDDRRQWIDTPVSELDTPAFGTMVDRCADPKADFADLAL
jgi:Ca2+-binding RTX toxin-like protein